MFDERLLSTMAKIVQLKRELGIEQTMEDLIHERFGDELDVDHVNMLFAELYVRKIIKKYNKKSK